MSDAAPKGPNLSAGETLEDFVFEQLGFVQLYAGIAQSYVAAGDRAGLNYSMRQLIARTKVAARVVNDIASETQADDERRAENLRQAQAEKDDR